MQEILTGYRLRHGTGGTFCDDESTEEIMRCLAEDIDRALAKGEPIHLVEFEYGPPTRSICRSCGGVPEAGIDAFGRCRVCRAEELSVERGK